MIALCWDVALQATFASRQTGYNLILRYLAAGQINLAYISEGLVKLRLGGESNRLPERILRKGLEGLLGICKNGLGRVAMLAEKNFSKLAQLILKE